MRRLMEKDLRSDVTARAEQWLMTIVQLRNPTQNSKLPNLQFLIPRSEFEAK